MRLSLEAVALGIEEHCNSSTLEIECGLKCPALVSLAWAAQPAAHSPPPSSRCKHQPANSRCLMLLSAAAINANLLMTLNFANTSCQSSGCKLCHWKRQSKRSGCSATRTPCANRGHRRGARLLSD